MLTDNVIAETDFPVVVNITNPVPILQQNKSSIITNPFIPNEQKEFEIELLNKEASEILEKEYQEKQRDSIKNQTIEGIFKKMINSILGVLDDIFKKPEDINFFHHLLNILSKENRYAYIGVFLILMVIIYNLLRGYLMK